MRATPISSARNASEGGMWSWNRTKYYTQEHSGQHTPPPARSTYFTLPTNFILDHNVLIRKASSIYTVVSRYYDTAGIRKKYHNIQTIEIFSINLLCFVIVGILIWYHNKQYFKLSDIVITRDYCIFDNGKTDRQKDTLTRENINFLQLFWHFILDRLDLNIIQRLL